MTDATTDEPQLVTLTRDSLDAIAVSIRYLVLSARAGWRSEFFSCLGNVMLGLPLAILWLMTGTTIGVVVGVIGLVVSIAYMRDAWMARLEYREIAEMFPSVTGVVRADEVDA